MQRASSILKPSVDAVCRLTQASGRYPEASLRLAVSFLYSTSWQTCVSLPTAKSCPAGQASRYLLALQANGRRRVLLANFAVHPVEVLIRGLAVKSVEGLHLDETTAHLAMKDPQAYRCKLETYSITAGAPLRLRSLPYAVARLDLER